MMADATLKCTVCGSFNKAPRVHANLLKKTGTMQMFCPTCNDLRSHLVTGGNVLSNAPPAAAGSSPAGTSMGAFDRGVSSPGGAPAGGNIDDDALWKALEVRMGAAHLSMDELTRVDDVTRGRLFASLGFDALQEARLHRAVAMKKPQDNSSASRMNAYTPGNYPTAAMSGMNTSGATAAGGGASPMPMVSNFASPYSGGGNSSNVGGGLPTASTIPGLIINGDQLVARCSVYPHLPAEFWCCACSVLVSSRCHVQGSHKDHPFISLRMAAEAHVRDLCGWTERCRTQLNVAMSVVNNLRHADQLAQSAVQQQAAALDDHVVAMIDELKRWRDQLKADMQTQVAAQASAIEVAAKQTEAMHILFSTCLSQAEPLTTAIPALDDGNSKAGEEWALRVLDLVSRLKLVHAETIPMPKVVVPQVTCQATPATNMELLKCVAVPLSVRLPDVMDPGYFNFPYPSVGAKVPFTVATNDEASSKGVVVYNGRTVTRTQDTVPAHHLVCSSQVFYNGSVSWEVHLDRLGPGPSRVLLGIVVNGSDGEGVVWDGNRIVGPNEGECRSIDERYVWRQGTVLRFHLELEPPQCFLNCFFDRDGVARIPLPSTGMGWTPAFSVFGPQDQITVVPHVNASKTGMGMAMDKRPAQRAAGDTVAHLERQDHLISSLHQQIQQLQVRLEQEQSRQGGQNMQSQPGAFGLEYAQQQQPPQVTSQPQNRSYPGLGTQGNNMTSPPSAPPPLAPIVQPTTGFGAPQGGGFNQPAMGSYGGAGAANPPLPARPSNNLTLPQGGGGGTGGRPLEAYSPELRQLMRYVDDLNA